MIIWNNIWLSYKKSSATKKSLTLWPAIKLIGIKNLLVFLLKSNFQIVPIGLKLKKNILGLFREWPGRLRNYYSN